MASHPSSPASMASCILNEAPVILAGQASKSLLPSTPPTGAAISTCCVSAHPAPCMALSRSLLLPVQHMLQESDCPQPCQDSAPHTPAHVLMLSPYVKIKQGRPSLGPPEKTESHRTPQRLHSSTLPQAGLPVVPLYHKRMCCAAVTHVQSQSRAVYTASTLKMRMASHSSSPALMASCILD
jgi:hypothetical protein